MRYYVCISALTNTLSSPPYNFGQTQIEVTGPQGPQGPTGPQGPPGTFDVTLLTNTAFLNTLATNQMASNTSDFVVSTKAIQTLTFTPIPSVTFVPNKTVKLKVTSSLNLSPITYTCANPTVGVVSGGLLTLKGSGTTTITATQAGDPIQ